MKRILVLCDDVWHPAEVIERGLNGIPQNRYAFDYVRTAKDILTPEMLFEYPLTVIAKSNEINGANPEPWFEDGVTEADPACFRRYVESGRTLLLLHAGCCFSRDEMKDRPERFQKPHREFLDLLGSSFLGHPLRSDVTYTSLNTCPWPIDDARPFTVRDEHYQLDVFAPDAEVFLRSSSSEGGVDRTAGYVRRLGSGRLIVLTPGHTLAVYQTPEFRRLLLGLLDDSLEGGGEP